MESRSWFEIAGCLEDIMVERLEAYGLLEVKSHVVDQDVIITLMKNADIKESDEWIADMLICAKRILADDCKVNIKQYTEVDDMVQPDFDLDDEPSMLEDILDYDQTLLLELLPEIKNMICTEFTDDYQMHNEIQSAMVYFTSIGYPCATLEELKGVITELDVGEMKSYLEHIYVHDDSLAAYLDNLLLANIQ